MSEIETLTALEEKLEKELEAVRIVLKLSGATTNGHAPPSAPITLSLPPIGRPSTERPAVVRQPATRFSQFGLTRHGHQRKRMPNGMVKGLVLDELKTAPEPALAARDLYKRFKGQVRYKSKRMAIHNISLACSRLVADGKLVVVTPHSGGRPATYTVAKEKP